MHRLQIVVFFTALSLLSAMPTWAQALNTEKIEQLTGLKGLPQDEDVFQVTYPRKDLHPVVAGVWMTPPMGLTAWAAFQRAGSHTMVMGISL